MEDVVVIEHCKDCNKHKWCTNHDEKKYLDFYEKTKNQIESDCPEVTVIQNQEHPSIQPILSQKTDRTPFTKLSFPKTGSFEVYFRGKLIFSKLKHGIWPHPAMVAKNIRDIIDGVLDVKSTPQATGFKEYQSKPEVPKRTKPNPGDKLETVQKLNKAPSPAKAASPDPPRVQKEEKKIELKVEEKKVFESEKRKEMEKSGKEDGQKGGESSKKVEESGKGEMRKGEDVLNKEVLKQEDKGSKENKEVSEKPVEVEKKLEGNAGVHEKDEKSLHQNDPKTQIKSIIENHDESVLQDKNEKPANVEESHKNVELKHEEPKHEESKHGELKKNEPIPEDPPKTEHSKHEDPHNHDHFKSENNKIEELTKHEHSHPENTNPIDAGSEHYEDDAEIQESNNHPPYSVTESFKLELPVGEGKNSKIPLKNTKDSTQLFTIQVKNSSLLKVLQTEYTVDPGVPQKLKLEILPQSQPGEKKGFIIVESDKEVVACLEIVVDVN